MFVKTLILVNRWISAALRW